MSFSYKKAYDRLLLAFAILSILVFIFYPFMEVLRRAFYDQGRWSWIALKNIFSDRNLIVNTLILGFWSTLFSTLSSTLVAVYIFITGRKARAFFSVLLMITMVSPPFVTALSYINLFGRRGLITYHLLGLSLFPYGMWGIVWMQVLSHLSINTLMLYGLCRTLPKETVQSARSLGATSDHLISDILLPYLRTGILGVALLSFFRAVSDFGTPAIIGGRFKVLASEAYFAVIAQGDFQRAAAINVLILIPALIIYRFYRRLIQTQNKIQHGLDQQQAVIPPHGLVYQLIRLPALFFLIWLSLQYGSIILNAFIRMDQGRVFWTIENFREARPYITGTLLRSVVYSLIAAFFGSILGLVLAYYVRIRQIRWISAIDFIAGLPYILSGTFFGLGYLFAFNHPPLALTGTAAIVVLNVLFKQMPFSTRMAHAQLDTVSQESVRAVRDLGGSHTDVLKDVVFPAGRDGLILSFMNGFIATMTTVGSIIFLVYPGQKVLTLVMFDVIQSGKYEIGSVIAVIIIALCFFVHLLSEFFRKRSAYAIKN